MAERKRKAPTNIKKSTKMQQVTVGTNIRMEKPSSNRQPKPNVVSVVAQEVNPMNGFLKFVRDYGVIGVAVGFAIASQAQLLIALLFNTGDPASQVIILHFRDRTGEIKWGILATQLMNFIFVLIVIYALIKISGLDKLDDKDKKKK
jgi:large-conductance mechanosensitive channel